LLVRRYLARYAQPEIAALEDLDTDGHARVLVIPCYDEPPEFLDDLLPANARDLLVIVVVNAPDNAPRDARAGSVRLLEKLRGATSRPLSVVAYSRPRNIQLLVIDRVSDDRLVPYRQGVGLARKIGADCALALICANRVHSEWIYVTDADVYLPRDYLRTPMPESGTALFPFRHVSQDPRLQTRAELYELHLRYYVNRLAHARSPYAYHTLGSTTAVHALAYAKVRGYPRRNAGEDFYLLNKLAKVDTIHELDAPPIAIQARRSNRVPFGTGVALEKIPDSAQTYTSYASASFEMLREVLASLDAVAAGEPWQGSAEADAALEALGFFRALDNAQRQNRSPVTLGKALHQWFDGFRTLRFIHQCRRFHDDAPLLATLATILGPGSSDSTEPARSYLQQLRKLPTPKRHGITQIMPNGSHKPKITSPGSQ
jgi:hypothetical protein